MQSAPYCWTKEFCVIELDSSWYPALGVAIISSRVVLLGLSGFIQTVIYKWTSDESSNT